MEKLKKSQNEKSFLKNFISSLKPDLKNFQNIFVISVFLVFIFIMAATAISVWMNKQAEPPTVEEYCANCKVFDVQQENINLLKSPSTALPVLRIFGKDIQVCQQACQNLRPIFNIQFECVPMAKASKETIKEVYTAFDFLKKAGNLAENKSTDKEKLNEEKQEQKYVFYSSLTKGKVKLNDQGTAAISKNQNEQDNQKEADQAAANLFLELDPRTVFFIGGHILTFDGIPNKENICEVVNDPACPPKNSSFIPKEKFFGLVKNCYAFAQGSCPSATTDHSSHWGGSLPSATTDHSTHWGGTPPSAAGAPTVNLDDVSNWDSVTFNDDGSATIGGNNTDQTVTEGYTGSWDGGTFNVGTGGSSVAINLGGNNSSSNIAIGSDGITFTSDDVSVTFGDVDITYTSITIDISENAVNWPELINTLNSLNALNQEFAMAIAPELTSLAAPADCAWIAQILSDPNQNFYYALTHNGLDTNNNVQTGAMITESSIVIGSDVYVAFGDASWEGYFYSGSPHEITLGDEFNWELTMMTKMTNDGSLEFLAYNPNVDNGDGTFGNFVLYDPADPNANEIAYGYQLVVNEPASGASSSGASSWWGAAAAVIGGAGNNPPVAQIGCDCPLCQTTNSIILNNNSWDLEDGKNFSNCLWNIYRYPSMAEVNPSPYNTCDDLSFLSLQVGDYQAKLELTDQSGLSNTTTRDFHILQEITADFDYDPEKPRYGEEVKFFDQSVGTGKPEGAGNYDIINWDWTFEDIEAKESTQTSDIKNPVIIFIEDGTKTVTLTVTDETNRSASYSEDVYVRFPPPNWKEVHPGKEQYNQQGQGQYDQQKQESCREKCESLGYMHGICRVWSTFSRIRQEGCKIGEEDIGETCDCKSFGRVEKTCCCRYLKTQ